MSGPAIVIGTRPEIIKMAPLVDVLGKQARLIHTGQHYSFNMSQVFLDELGLRRRIEFLDIGAGTQAAQTGNALVGLETSFLKDRPSIVLVEGDTNTVLAGALAACKLGIPVGHVEAGLRSYDNRMPEEHNRRMTDHVSNLLFAPTKDNAAILRDENVPGAIHVTGNTVIDACLHNLPIALRRSRIMDTLDLKSGAYAVATVHRAENVDDAKVLSSFISIFSGSPLPVLLPLHPRTVKNAKRFGLWRRISGSKNIRVIEPVGYWDFLALMKNSGFLLTDSGGIQEEATAPPIRKKCFVLRISTERQEAVKAGFCELLGVDPEKALKVMARWWKAGANVPEKASPFGDGRSAGRIAMILGKGKYI